jgi:hypothetical protein
MYIRKILLALAVFFVVNSAFSQIRYGVKAGVNIASLSDVDLNEDKYSVKMYEHDRMIVGFHAGAFANVSLSDIFGFQPEILFSMHGSNQKIGYLFEGIVMSDGKFNFRFNYIQIPLLFEIKPVANLGILAGPQLSWNIYRAGTSYYYEVPETLSGAKFIDDGFKKLDASLAFGLQYMFLKKITLGARYNLGLTNTLNLSEDDYSLKGWKNNVIQVSLGYSFK